MDIQAQPLVSILTPVYNGEKYLAECIESVFAQTYDNWEYIIVNNCSTDGTLAIAQNYARKDTRIHVYSNAHFVGAIDNHNIAFTSISPQSKYCKVVSADDWIYPECIVKLVQLSEINPSVGIVGSYSINADGVPRVGLPYDKTVFTGREVCRLYLLGSIAFFGTPSTVLYRSDLVRSRTPFFPPPSLKGDGTACLNCLQVSDFGFVHQILSFERIHDEALNATLRKLNAFVVYPLLNFLLEYGPIFLTPHEFSNRLEEVLEDYYNFLAVSAFNFRNTEFWNYHKGTLKELGYRFYSIRLAKSIFMKFLDLLFNPKQTIEKTLRRFEFLS
jgi:glycosyltransferase involved in cell wall biosynthesis